MRRDVQKVFPEAVTAAKDGYLQFNMSPINFAMINAVKDLKHENDNLRAQLATLQQIGLKAQNDNVKTIAADSIAAPRWVLMMFGGGMLVLFAGFAGLGWVVWRKLRSKQ